MNKPVLRVNDLNVDLVTRDGQFRAVSEVSMTLHEREVLGVVGESGSGKTVMAHALLALHREHGVRRYSGEVVIDGKNVLELSEGEVRSVRGKRIAMIFQDPMTALNPLHRVGTQLKEMFDLHDKRSPDEVRERCVTLLEEVGVPEPRKRLRAFPHELSGGQRQRVVIAMALACNPAVIVADEPTSALDVTVQAQLLRVLGRHRDEYAAAIVLITHDFGLMAEIADTIMVMYAGRVVEYGDVNSVFYKPQHPYTWSLLNSIPQPGTTRGQPLESIVGMPPSLATRPTGCTFRTRCPYARGECEREPLFEWDTVDGDLRHGQRCWLTAAERETAWRERLGRRAKVHGSAESLGPAKP